MNKRLTEIDLIRLFLILLLVGYHAFAPFCGAWKPVSDTDMPSYWWVGKAFYACMLETFVFISGYVYGYQCRLGKVNLNFNQLALKKTKRLMLPCFVFSLAYLCLFGFYENETYSGAIYSLVNGRGHMWFLPTLLWCFIATDLLRKINVKHFKSIVGMLLMIAVTPMITLPLQISAAMYYLFFFYLGYIIQYKELDLLKYANLQNIAFTATAFVTVFVATTAVCSYSGVYGGGYLIDNHIVNLCVERFGKVIYSTLGVITMILVGLRYTSRYTLPVVVTKAAGYCFGIYLFQQFILKYLYYYTPWAIGIRIEILPWLALMVTLIVSVTLTHVFIHTKFGKQLIG